MRLTRNFLLSEFAVSSQFPELAKAIQFSQVDIVKTFYLCSGILQPGRNIIRAKIFVRSGKRTLPLNFKVKGATKSDHLYRGFSCAADIQTEDREKLFFLYRFFSKECFFLVGEVILYFTEDWSPHFIHLSLPTKRHQSKLFYDYNKGKEFKVISQVPDSVYVKIFGKELRR
jgi:hypothetical protein